MKDHILNEPFDLYFTEDKVDVIISNVSSNIVKKLAIDWKMMYPYYIQHKRVQLLNKILNNKKEKEIMTNRELYDELIERTTLCKSITPFYTLLLLLNMLETFLENWGWFDA